MPFTIGENVGPYRITDRLGQGGMATVYRAYHAKLDRYVAIKVLHPAFKEDAGFLTRFQREAQIVARLEHPHIVPIYDSADHEGQPYLVMKFIEGQTLKGRLSDKPLTLPEMMQMSIAVGQALTYAHEAGVLHRDIKPSNILLEKNVTPYLADFGLARMAGAGELTLSQDMMLGTPQYISPEQAQGVRDLDAGTDIYSFGVVLYELLVGRVPFNADTPYAIVHDHIFSPLPLPSSVNPQVPPAVEHVLLKALAKDRRDRYASAVQMVEAFRQAIDESHMTVISAASYRVPLTTTPRAGPGSTILDTPVLPLTPAPVPLVPTPVPSFLGSSILGVGGISSASLSQSQVVSTLRRREQIRRQRANLWILGGVTGLILALLASLIVTVSAVTDPNIRGSLFIPRISPPPPLATPIAAVETRDAHGGVLGATGESTRRATASPTRTALSTANATAPITASVSGLATDLSTDSATDNPTANVTGGTASGVTETATPSTAESLDSATPTPVYVIPDPGSVAAAQALVDKDNTNPVYWFALALADVRYNHALKMQNSLSQALMLTGDNEALLMAAARAFSETREPRVAIFVYARALGVPNLTPADHSESVKYLYGRAKSASAGELTTFELVMRTFPKVAAVQALAALALSSAGQFDQANLAIGRAQSLNSTLPEVHLVQGLLFSAQNQPASARIEFQSVIDTATAPRWMIDNATSLLN